MLYTQWVRDVLDAMVTCENDRTRLVGLPAAALRESLGVDLSEDDAIGDALYDLAVLGLAQRRPGGAYDLTALGRQAAAGSIEAVCGTTIQEACTALTDQERGFLRALLALAQTEYAGFARMRYVDVDTAFAEIGLHGSHEEQESFLLPLVVHSYVDYREFSSGRDARPLFTGVICGSTTGDQADTAIEGPAKTLPL